MKDKLLKTALDKANKEGKNLVAPLVGFPALKLTNSTIKIAQQNYFEHYKVLEAILENFNPDAIFPLMDLSVEANALGRYTLFPKEESATVVIEKFKEEELDRIKNVDVKCDMRLLGYVEIQKRMKQNFPDNVIRGAYVTGPYTLAALLTGADEAAMATIINSDYLMRICDVAYQKIGDYIELLIEAGAQSICILEPSAVMLGPEQFKKFSGDFVSKYCEKYRDTDVSFIYHICGNSMHLVELMEQAGVDALSLDSPETGVYLVEAAKRVNEKTIIIGNINPTGTILNGCCQNVNSDVDNLLKQMKDFPNFILSTGCDLPQETPIENIKCFMDAGRKN